MYLLSLEQEILVSYRLLFGQNSRSNALIRQELDRQKRSGNPFDDILYILCGNLRIEQVANGNMAFMVSRCAHKQAHPK